MRFRDLLRLRRDEEGVYIPEDTLRKLHLPMPEQVFQQLVVDHALTPFTQRTFGNLDLHGIRWDSVTLPAQTIAAADYVHCADSNLESSERQAEQVAAKGWRHVTVGLKHTRRWKQHKTWLECPVFVEGVLVGSAAQMFLVEGHRRLGTLRGLVKCGWLEPGSPHKVWIGCVQDPPHPEGPWRNVVREEPVPFAIWLCRLRRGGGDESKIAEVFGQESYGWGLLGPPDTDVVFEFAESQPELKNMLDTLRALEAEWKAYTNP